MKLVQAIWCEDAEWSLDDINHAVNVEHIPVIRPRIPGPPAPLDLESQDVLRAYFADRYVIKSAQREPEFFNSVDIIIQTRYVEVDCPQFNNCALKCVVMHRVQSDNMKLHDSFEDAQSMFYYRDEFGSGVITRRKNNVLGISYYSEENPDVHYFSMASYFFDDWLVHNGFVESNRGSGYVIGGSFVELKPAWSTMKKGIFDGHV